jgi:hypothetical protein
MDKKECASAPPPLSEMSVYILMLGTCEYVTLLGKKDLANVY